MWLDSKLRALMDRQVLEQASAEEILAAPKQDYTKRLLAAIPRGYRVTSV
jgi:peptide/nickel transport system ATP-binding protein